MNRYKIGLGLAAIAAFFAISVACELSNRARCELAAALVAAWAVAYQVLKRVLHYQDE